jgi:hypothetical protein
MQDMLIHSENNSYVPSWYDLTSGEAFRFDKFGQKVVFENASLPTEVLKTLAETKPLTLLSSQDAIISKKGPALNRMKRSLLAGLITG